MDLDPMIVNVNEYDLEASADDFVAAIDALATRTETEGHPGVLHYRFHVNRAEDTAGAVIVYADADAWVEHHRMAYEWDEMATLQATVSLRRLTLLGRANQTMEEMAAGLPVPVVVYDTLAAGFIRRQPHAVAQVQCRLGHETAGAKHTVKGPEPAIDAIGIGERIVDHAAAPTQIVRVRLRPHEERRADIEHYQTGRQRDRLPERQRKRRENSMQS